MKTERPSRFWAEGGDEFLKSLDYEEKRLIAPLQVELERNKAERKRIESDIDLIKRQFKKKRRDAKGFLFARS